MYTTTTPTKMSLLKGKDLVLKAISKENYRYDRYNIPFCLAAINTENTKHFDYMKRYIRKTDILIPLSENCACIALASTEIPDAIKMGENFIKDHATLGDNNRIYIGVTSVKHTHHNYDIVSRAFYTLDKAREQNISAVEDDNILENMKACI